MPINRAQCDQFVAFMNEIYKLDPEWAAAICNFRPPCNESIAQHKTIQAGISEDHKHYEAGFLGLMNGFFGTYDDGPRARYGAFAATYEDGRLTGFTTIENH